MSQDPLKRRRLPRPWLLCAGGVIVVLAAVLACSWLAGGSDSYEVDGLPFRQWLARNPNFQIRDPLARLGTNAVPHLVRILRRAPEPARVFAVKESLWNHLPNSFQARFRRLRPISDWEVRNTALFAVRFLGPEAREALPYVLRIAWTETNLTVRAGALVAALNTAPQAPETFELWRSEWRQTNHFSRHDLALYLAMPRVPVPAAVLLLVNELTNRPVEADQAVVQAFGFFGEAALPALPHLIRSFEAGGPGRLDLLQVFWRLGPLASNAVPALVACLQERGPEKTRAYDSVKGAEVEIDYRPGLVGGTLRALQAIGPAAKPALPTIAVFLTSSDSAARLLAAAAQVRAGGPVPEALAVLLAGLQDDRHRASETVLGMETIEPTTVFGVRGPEAAVILCGELGDAAIEALPVVKRRLQDTNPWMRISAAQAVWRISHDASVSLPTLVAFLDSVQGPGPQSPSVDEYNIVRAIETIEEMGSAAKAAAPSIERARTFSIAVRHAANKALAALDQGQ